MASKVILAISLVALPSCATPPRSTHTRLMQSTLLTRVTNAYPSWSPDGESIAFMSNATGDFEIYVMAVNGTALSRLTNAPGRDGAPVWSPDGARIAFESYRDGAPEIYVMNADGSDQRNLTHHSASDIHPVWSPDGKWIMFSSTRSSSPDNADPQFDVFVMRSDGAEVAPLIETADSTETYASWSPNGQEVVYRRVDASGQWDVVVYSVETGEVRVVASHPAVDGWPVWSPDGEFICFASGRDERDETTRLYLVRRDGSDLTRITGRQSEDDRQPAFSPDGRRIAYARYQWFQGEPRYEASRIEILDLRQPQVHAAPTAASTPRA